MKPTLQYFLYFCYFAIGVIVGRVLMAIQTAAMQKQAKTPQKNSFAAELEANIAKVSSMGKVCNCREEE